ncbi:MAG: serine/threonine-protein kinase [Myxococcota bacterium]
MTAARRAGTADRTTSLPAVSPVLPNQTQAQNLGRYQLLAKLAAGGMATVYLGRIAGVGGFDRRVAMKILHPHLAEDVNIRDMFLDEARLAARIRNPNVVPVIDVGDEPGHGTFLVMEYIEGVDFSKVIRAAAKRAARLAPPVVLRIVVDMLAGLTAAHELKDRQGEHLGVVHRDISPHNVIVGTDGISRITDFGIAKAEGRISSTKTGQLKGKLAYMPPERLQRSGGRLIDDARGDLFATAICLWEALTGKRLFRGDDDLETVRKVLHEDIPPPSSVRPDLKPLDEVVLKGLARDPEKRFQTAREFRRALEDVASRVGGLGRAEHVTQLLQALVGPSLERQRQAVEAAVQATEAAMSETGPVTSSFQLADRTPTRDTTGTALTTESAGGLVWKVSALVLLLALVGLGAYMFGRDNTPASTTALPTQTAAPPSEGPARLTPPLPAGQPMTVMRPAPVRPTPPPRTEEPPTVTAVSATTISATEAAAEPATDTPRAMRTMRPVRRGMRPGMAPAEVATPPTMAPTPMVPVNMTNTGNYVPENPYN